MSPEIFNAASLKKHQQEGRAQTAAHLQTTSGQQKRKGRRPEEYSSVLAAAQPTTNPYASFAIKPVGVSFDTQEGEENILLFLRQHWSVNIVWLVIASIMLLAPLFLFPSLAPFLAIPWNFKLVLTMFWYLLTAGFMIEKTIMWLFNSFIVTDERMVDIDIYSLIFKEVNYAQLDKIQDVTVKTGGALYSVLDVGDVFVQTAGEIPEFVFDNIEHPNKVAKLLNELLIEEHQEELEGRVR